MALRDLRAFDYASAGGLPRRDQESQARPEYDGTEVVIIIKGWAAIDDALAAVQRDFPLAAPALGQIRGDLTAMRYVLGTDPGPAAAVPAGKSPAPGGKQQQSIHDAMAFEPTTRQSAIAVATDVRHYGFTGSFCPDCGGSRMVRAGTCEHCSDCGATTGCS